MNQIDSSRSSPTRYEANIDRLIKRSKNHFITKFSKLNIKKNGELLF